LQQDSIERIRSATFSISRKGYDKREVERFLNKLADWLEAGGGDQARSDLVKRELERVGAKTARILSEAEDSAELIRTEAEQEVTATLNRAREQAADTKQDADDYAARTREEADRYGDEVRHEAESDAQETRARATQEARAAMDDAQAKARRIVEEGAKRRGDIEAVISDLMRHRDALLAGAEQLTSQLRSVLSEHTPATEDRFATPKQFDPREGGGAEPRTSPPARAAREQAQEAEQVAETAGKRASGRGSERPKQKTAGRRRKPAASR
jgi:DivIVA domain-containing protein